LTECRYGHEYTSNDDAGHTPIGPVLCDAALPRGWDAAWWADRGGEVWLVGWIDGDWHEWPESHTVDIYGYGDRCPDCGRAGAW